MKKNYTLTILIGLLFLSACSGDNSDTTPSPVVDLPIVTDLLTAQNVKNYMVDPNATAETAALFYNLKKLAKTKFAVGQQDAFLSF